MTAPAWVCIVEGHAEVESVPLLLRRVVDYVEPGAYVHVERPIRTHKDRLLNNEDEAAQKFGLAALKARQLGGVILVILDADDECPVELARRVSRLADRHAQGIKVCCAIANREYEAWLIGSAQHLKSHGVFVGSFVPPPEVDAPRDVKRLVGQALGKSYNEVIDQPRLSSRMDLEQAGRNSRSFRHLLKVVLEA